MNWKSAARQWRVCGGRVLSWYTWWHEGIILGEGELRLVVAAVVERVRVQDNESDAPLEDILVDELEGVLAMWLLGEKWCDIGTSMLVHVSLLRALNSFMSMRSADCAMVSWWEE